MGRKTEKTKHDGYCWNCAKSKADIACSKCIRSFHQKCLRNEMSGEDFICTECERQMEMSTKNDNEIELNMIPALVEFVMDDLMFVPLKDVQFGKTSGKLVNKIDLAQIKKKSSIYESFFDLRVDISWFVHNCQIAYPKNNDILHGANKLLDFVDEEILSLTTCVECYDNASKYPETSFTMPCNTPHLLIWAKAPGYIFWPAKAMSTKGRKVHVRFFGDHTTCDVDSSGCYVFSTENPECITVNVESYNEALEEANTYIKNIREKFGTFKHAPYRTLLDCSKLKEYANEMFTKSENQLTNKTDSVNDIDHSNMDTKRFLQQMNATNTAKSTHQVTINSVDSDHNIENIRENNDQLNEKNATENLLKRSQTQTEQTGCKKMRKNDDDDAECDREQEIIKYLNEEAEKKGQIVLNCLNDFATKAHQKIKDYKSFLMKDKMLENQTKLEQEKSEQQKLFDNEKNEFQRNIYALQKDILEQKNKFDAQKTAFEQKNVASEKEKIDQKEKFDVEKAALERIINGLRNDILEQKNTFDAQTTGFKQKVLAFEKEKIDQKKAFDDEKAALEQTIKAKIGYYLNTTTDACYDAFIYKVFDRFDEAQKYVIDKRSVPPVEYVCGKKFVQIVSKDSPVDFIDISSTDNDYSDEDESHERGEKEDSSSLNDNIDIIQNKIDDNELQVSNVDQTTNARTVGDDDD
ncbi:zinc finger MYND domain-containing protein 11-like, partial [Contarinia nasturtii]|uniref:zinc finger MYND domain-containing protein 11-like n=1 Tax=Contarinia nasturtii TaxID=265458 RepID=UPI0012D4173A